MAGYSGTPLYKKLGIQPDSRVCALRAPESFFESLREAPFLLLLDTAVDGNYDVIVFFVKEYSELVRIRESLIAALHKAGGLWIAWPKRASKVPTDITEDRLRDLFLPSTPMVDNKVCAIDEVWSGLRFVRRKEFR